MMVEYMFCELLNKINSRGYTIRFLPGWLGRAADFKLHGYSNSGQGLSEYAVIIALVAIVVIVVLALTGGSVLGLYNYAVPKIISALGG